jgi:hypothetical protein
MVAIMGALGVLKQLQPPVQAILQNFVPSGLGDVVPHGSM